MISQNETYAKQDSKSIFFLFLFFVDLNIFLHPQDDSNIQT